jgi:hypothetical protein
MCNEVTLLKPTPRMTEDEEKFCNIGKKTKVYHATRIISEEVLLSLNVEDYVQYVTMVEMDTAQGLFNDLYDKGVIKSRISGKEEKTITVSFPIVMMDWEVENFIDRDNRQTKQLLEACEREKEYRQLLAEARTAIELASFLETHVNMKLRNSKFTELANKISEKLRN